MKGLNKVQLIGNLGKDPEIRFTPDGKQVAKFSMAVNRAFNNKEGDSIEDTQWFNIDAWTGLAKVAEEQIRKALAKGIILPDGYTYVSDHKREQEKTQEKDLLS